MKNFAIAFILLLLPIFLSAQDWAQDPPLFYIEASAEEAWTGPAPQSARTFGVGFEVDYKRVKANVSPLRVQRWQDEKDSGVRLGMRVELRYYFRLRRD